MSYRKLYIKLTNWEYWPFHILYGPIYFYWFWLCIKARSFFFFNTSNPTIRYGGFLMESKKEIYDLLPKELYPATILCNASQSFEEIKKSKDLHQIHYPLIAKPDIGLRGMSVALLHSETELLQYHSSCKVDYLIQAYVPWEDEVGIFYYRYPGENKGRISGIVGKELLKVKGDGQSSIQKLIVKNDRFALQLDTLRSMYGDELNQVLKYNEERLLVPFGNHCRGAKFIDFTSLATGELNETIDKICSQIPGFYFGRLDIKYNNWDELCKGKNISIIELNGAGSEPAHIYDPKHSLWFAWKVIIHHWKVLYKISKMNKEKKNLTYMSMNDGLKMFKDNSKHIKLIA